MTAARITVRVLAVLGVLIWVALVVQRGIDGWPQGSWSVLVVAVVLAAAHAAVGIAVPARRRAAVLLASGILVADLVLAMAVDARAWILAAAAVVLVGAVLLACPRR